jgi:hypothetical protein
MVLLQGALPVCHTSFVLRDKGCRKRGLRKSFNIITDIRNKEPEQPVGNIFKTGFSQAKGNLELKIKKWRSWLSFKKEAQDQKVSVSI